MKKRTIMTTACAAAALALLGTGTVFAAGSIAEKSSIGAGNAIKAAGKDGIIGVGFDKSDAILGLIDDGYLLCTMAQNPDVMGSMGVEACVQALEGNSLGGEVKDTGVSVLKK